MNVIIKIFADYYTEKALLIPNSGKIKQTKNFFVEIVYTNVRFEIPIELAY